MTLQLQARRVGFGLVALTFALAMLDGPLHGASELPVDPERQSSVFQRIFSYDKHLRQSEKIVVIVVADSREDEESQQVAAVFREKGMYPAVVTVGDLGDDLTATLTVSSTVVYVTAGADHAAVKQFAAAKGYLTISGQPTLAEAGHVSVSVDLAGERPEIVVNMPRLQTEGHELSAELLNLARVIR